jgi:hypothetical protein
MVGTYSPGLVFLSIIVAIFASYVALDLASRVVASQNSKTARYWLFGGAISMGTGIWSMHFIGMLALRLPIPMSYDVEITLASLAIAVTVSGFALRTVSGGGMNHGRLLIAGMLMGLGIAAMHYVGMAAMQMAPPIHYDPWPFSLFDTHRRRRFGRRVVDCVSVAHGDDSVCVLEEGRERVHHGGRDLWYALYGDGRRCVRARQRLHSRSAGYQ